jgi:hypothetical protein
MDKSSEIPRSLMEGSMANLDDEAFRNVAADSMAQGFIVEILLSQYLRDSPLEHRRVLADSLVTTGKRTDLFQGLTNDEATAELFSDVVVRMHGALEGIVARAMARAAAAESRGGAESQ